MFGEVKAMGNVTRNQAEKNDNLGRHPNIYLVWQRGSGIFMGTVPVFVLLLLVSQASGQGYPKTTTLNCTVNDSKSLYRELESVLWNTSIRPVFKFEPLNLTLGIIIKEILGVDEKNQLLTIFLWQTLEWKLPFVSWNETLCGTKRISYPKEKLWIPDIVISEFMDEDKSQNFPYIYINYTGMVYMKEPKRVVAYCLLDLYNFPFDVQNCTLSYMSFLHEEEDIVLISRTQESIYSKSQGLIRGGGSWKFVNITQKSNNITVGSRSYFVIQYEVILQRIPGLFVANLLMPSCFLFTLDVFSFLMPPDNLDRSSFKMTLILGYIIFLLIMNDLLPPASQSTPLINVFFCLCLALMVASLLESVFIMNLIHGHHSPQVPKWIKILVLKYLARAMFMYPKTTSAVSVILNPVARDKLQSDIVGEAEKNVMEDLAVQELRKVTGNLLAIRQKLEENLKSKDCNGDWCMVGKVLDRFLFLVYVIFILVSFITIVILWAVYEKSRV